MKQLAKHPESHRFTLGSSGIQIWGGVRAKDPNEKQKQNQRSARSQRNGTTGKGPGGPSGKGTNDNGNGRGQQKKDTLKFNIEKGKFSEKAQAKSSKTQGTTGGRGGNLGTGQSGPRPRQSPKP